MAVEVGPHQVRRRLVHEERVALGLEPARAPRAHAEHAGRLRHEVDGAHAAVGGREAQRRRDLDARRRLEDHLALDGDAGAALAIEERQVEGVRLARARGRGERRDEERRRAGQHVDLGQIGEEAARAVAVAVHREEDLRAPLGEAVGQRAELARAVADAHLLAGAAARGRRS